MKINTILWDFDGVILDSMAIRDWGFREIFNSYSEEDINSLIAYHRKNGGLSRYVKIRYFYEEILGKEITQEKILDYAASFSNLMKQELTNPKNLIQDALHFIKNNYNNFNFHIVSGSDQKELRFLCTELGLRPFFTSIHGSPTPKKVLVSELILAHNYNINQTCLIGDSINDYEAAEFNNISFFGYNNREIKNFGQKYINTFHKDNTFITPLL